MRGNQGLAIKGDLDPIQVMYVAPGCLSQSVRQRTLDFSSSLDLRVLSSSPALGSTLGVGPILKKRKYDSVS